VFSQIDLPPLTLVNAKVIGVMRMIDKEEMDDKIIAVASTDIAVNHIENLDQFPEFILNEIHRFFEDYKKQGNLNPVVIPQLLGKPEAFAIIEEALSGYKKKFENGKRI
jgi:inorganic pyrophosphatase